MSRAAFKDSASGQDPCRWVLEQRLPTVMHIAVFHCCRPTLASLSPLLCAQTCCSLRSMLLCAAGQLLSHTLCCTHHLDLEVQSCVALVPFNHCPS